MYFTISATQSEGKKLLKKIIPSKKWPLLGGRKAHYTANEAENYLRSIGQTLEENGQKEIELSLILHDKEGKIEREGTDYLFGPLLYQISEGYYPTLIDLIRLDLFRDSDENMSVEESFRNEKILQVLEEALNTEEQSESTPSPKASAQVEPAPWERPIFSEAQQKESKVIEPTVKKEEVVTDDASLSDLDQGLFEEETLEEPEEGVEENEEEEREEKIEEDDSQTDTAEVTDSSATLMEWTEEQCHHFMKPLLEEELEEQKNEIQHQTALSFIEEQYPPAHHWLKEKNKLFLNELYTKYALPQTYQAFLESQQELIDQSKGMLQEQLQNVQSLDWRELAQEETQGLIEERQAENEQEVTEYTTEQNQIWEKTKQDLTQEEEQLIDQEIQKIKDRYEKKRDQAFQLFTERVQQFMKTNEEALEREKAALIDEKEKALRKAYYQSLQQDKLAISRQLNEELNKVYRNTSAALTEKQAQIQQELANQLKVWEEEYAAQQRAEAEKQRIKQEEAQKQLALEVRQKENELKAAELAIEQEQLKQQRELEEAARLERKEQQEAQLEQLRQAQFNYYTQPTAKETAIKQETQSQEKAGLKPSLNGWMIGCLTSLGLLIGGGTIFAVDHIHQATPSSNESTITSYSPMKENRTNEDYYDAMTKTGAPSQEEKTSTSPTIAASSEKEWKESSKEAKTQTASTSSSTTTESSVTQSNEVK